MRIIVRSSNITDCEKRVKIKQKEGWKPITGIKLDNSGIEYTAESYVCVMEKEGQKERNWSSNVPGWW